MKAVEVIIGGHYWVKDAQGDLVSAKWDGDKWILTEKPNNKDLVNGDYSYTERIGDLSITLTFKTNAELLAFHHSQNKD